MARDERPLVLWGSHAKYADGTVIKLSGGTLRECRARRTQRTREGGWTLAIYPVGVEPEGLRGQVAAEKAAS